MTMMVLKSGDNGRTAAMQKVVAARRKRGSKGTKVSYGAGSTSTPEANEAPESQQPSISNSSVAMVPSGSKSSQPQQQNSHASGPEAAPPGSVTPCHYGRLVLMCVQNAIRMGSRTQLFLCPPGRVRRELQATLRQNARINPALRSGIIEISSTVSSGGGYYSLEKFVGSEAFSEYDARDEEFLLSSNTFDDDSDEEASSGDEDAMIDFDDLFSDEPPELDDQERYINLREPLFIAAGSESALSNAGGPQMGSPTGKLPFNRRKIRFFDSINANDSAAARAYVKREIQRSKKRAAIVLSRHLRKLQIEARRKRRRERGQPTDDLNDAALETPEERAILNNGVEPFQHPMTPSVAAALLLESLSANPVESVEGMSKCYDGIVAAGVALLDAQELEPTGLSSNNNNNSNEGKSRALRSEIMAALAPLLISSLEQTSGEVILMLAKLRRMCATPRYQRRFVQRVAPALIRPPLAAMWCLKHQNDMEAILAATELIFDSAFDVFRKGWYDKGRLLLADSKRAETLNSVAKQLRNLSSESAADGGLALGLPGHGNRRRLIAAAGRKGDASGGSNESLAEWEVIAVDQQIRISISSVMSQDWSRTAIHSDIPKPHNRRATFSTGVKRVSVLPQASSAEMSPKSIASPRSPTRSIYKTPQSPPYMPATASSNVPENIENVFGPSFTNQLNNALPAVHDRERALSPPPPNIMSASPPIQRSNSKEMDSSKPPNTPPRSPKSPTRPSVSDTIRGADQAPTLAPLSPKRMKSPIVSKEVVGSTHATQQQTPLTPLSPSASSVGSTEMVSYRPTPSSASLSAASSTVAHYRMLTSTAAERKRTVAACRALRAQIQRFEDAFIQLHGRAPKGATERAPLATTYAQYREWKRAIRADAACRIQALFRGSSTRWKLLRMNDPQITRLIMNQAGRLKGSEELMDRIGIPGISEADQESSPNMALSPSASDTYNAPGQTLAPRWPSKIRRRSPSDRETLPTAPVPKQFPAPASPTPTSSSDLNTLSLPELQARKRELKQQLKQYDMNFARKHGRMPVKAEKEPIRHLYEAYNALKSQIHQADQEGRHLPTSPALSPVGNAAAVISTRAASPPSGSDSGHSGGEDSPSRASPLLSRAKQHKVPKAISPPIAAVPTPGPDLASLKAEKTQLHQMLRAYEKEFYKDHKRQVSSFADIKPVASQYRRYKEIKKAIAAYQQGEKKFQQGDKG